MREHFYLWYYRQRRVISKFTLARISFDYLRLPYVASHRAGSVGLFFSQRKKERKFHAVVPPSQHQFERRDQLEIHCRRAILITQNDGQRVSVSMLAQLC